MVTPSTFVVLASASLSLVSGCTAEAVPASAERLAATCRADGTACTQAFAAWGLTPPQGTIDRRPRGGLELRLSPTALAVDDVTVLALAEGRPAPGTFVEHVASSLLSALEPQARAGREQAARAGAEWNAHASVLADRATPSSTLGDALFTATRAGFTEFELVVYDGHELRGQPIGVPFAWLPHDPDIKRERPLEVLFVVHADAVEARVAGEARRRFARPDLAAIAAFAAEIKRAYPNEVVATFRVDGEVTLQALVSLIDVVRGEGCRLSGAEHGESIPAECLFWIPVVDVAP